MKKVAILRCLRAERNCTGAACFNAFNKKKAHFAQYGQEDLEMTAFFTCNGCAEIDFHDPDGLQEKLERIIRIGTEVVHVGVCTRTRVPNGGIGVCPVIQEMVQYLQEHGVEIVWGTHA